MEKAKRASVERYSAAGERAFAMRAYLPERVSVFDSIKGASVPE